MAAVASAFQSLNVPFARRAIEDAQAIHRNWEWRHFNHLLDRSSKLCARW
jgi:hypothetical protein